jgi:hypothetical protein
MDKQHFIIQTTDQEAGKLAPNIANPLGSRNITFRNDFGEAPVGLGHFTRDQGALAILTLAGAFVGSAFGGFPMAGAIILAGLNDIRYAGKLDERQGSQQEPPQSVVLDVPAQMVEPQLVTPEEGEVPNTQLQPPDTPLRVATPTRQVNIQAMLGMPPDQRAIAILSRLNKDGFDVSRCIAEQITCICGNQRGGKGTLMAILAILCCAIDANTKVHYFTAGDDIYPFRCDRLVCRLNYPDLDGEQADGKVAGELYKYLKQMDNGTQGSYQNIVLVIDEAVALSDYLSADQKQWMIRFLLTRANKKGAQIFIVLHGNNLTSWVGTGNTSGLSSTFKSGVTFIGCESTSRKLNHLRSISVATGRYFLASPDDFSKPLEGGDLGTVPDWLKSETNPATGQPDPARTLLKFFPELYDTEPRVALTEPIGDDTQQAWNRFVLESTDEQINDLIDQRRTKQPDAENADETPKTIDEQIQFVVDAIVEYLTEKGLDCDTARNVFNGKNRIKKVAKSIGDFKAVLELAAEMGKITYVDDGKSQRVGLVSES